MAGFIASLKDSLRTLTSSSRPASVASSATSAKVMEPLPLPVPLTKAQVSQLPATQSKPAKAVETNMSWISNMIKDTESIASKIEHELGILWGKAPSFTAVALTALTYVGPLLEAVFTMEFGAAAGDTVTQIINTAQRDLLAAKQLLTTVGPTPTIAGMIAGVNANLSTLMAAGGVKNPQSVANLKLITGELNALATSFPVAAVAA